jgi:hypothetical protein
MLRTRLQKAQAGSGGSDDQVAVLERENQRLRDLLAEQAEHGATRSGYLCKYRAHSTASLWTPTWELRWAPLLPAISRWLSAAGGQICCRPIGDRRASSPTVHRCCFMGRPLVNPPNACLLAATWPPQLRDPEGREPDVLQVGAGRAVPAARPHRPGGGGVPGAGGPEAAAPLDLAGGGQAGREPHPPQHRGPV